jgi:GT2 family glycosyltransferase
MYGEDIDLCRRIGEHYKTMFHPGQSVIHRHEAASYKNYRMMWIHIVNVSRYFNKWGWFFDKKRTITNRKTLQEINELKFKSTYAAGR